MHINERTKYESHFRKFRRYDTKDRDHGHLCGYTEDQRIQTVTKIYILHHIFPFPRFPSPTHTHFPTTTPITFPPILILTTSPAATSSPLNAPNYPAFSNNLSLNFSFIFFSFLLSIPTRPFLLPRPTLPFPLFFSPAHPYFPTTTPITSRPLLTLTSLLIQYYTHHLSLP